MRDNTKLPFCNPSKTIYMYKYNRLGCHPKKCAIGHFQAHRTLFEYNIL